MKIAKIDRSLTSAVFNGSEYIFGNCRKGRGQCGEYTNDTLNLQGLNRAGDTLKSKCDALDFKTVKEGLPIPGGYFVMKYGTTGHIGVIRKADYTEGQEETLAGLKGIFITDYNWDLKEGRRDTYIAVGSSDWKKIVGFGVGNPVIEYDEKPSPWAAVSWEKALRKGIITKNPRGQINAQDLEVILFRMGYLGEIQGNLSRERLMVAFDRMSLL